MKYDHIHDALFDLTSVHFTDDEIQKIINSHNGFLDPNGWDLSEFIDEICFTGIGMSAPRFGDTEQYKFNFNQNSYKLTSYLEKYSNSQ